MKDFSIFDVIGPNMIGPSSSHTAGALRIAKLAHKMVRSKIIRADFVLYGSFARTYRGHGTDRALVAGVLGFDTEDDRIRDSFKYADTQGLTVTFDFDLADNDVHPNTVDVRLMSEDGSEVVVRGVSTGGGSCRIERINGISVSLSGEYNTLLIRQKDRYGVVAYIAQVLSDYQINIAFMRLYREKKGETAYTIIEVDGDIPEEAEAIMEKHKDIERALIIRLEGEN